MLEITRLTLGPVSTNCYLVADSSTKEAVVVDPAWDGKRILAEAGKRDWKIGQCWYTHAHFDHFGGAADLCRLLDPAPAIALHSADLPLWEKGGGAAAFGFQMDPGPRPQIDLASVHDLSIGSYRFKVQHAPGHSPGLCLFYCPQEAILFSGDLIFQGSVGRTDLPGGDWETLLTSIRDRVYTLPGETRIFSGHGEATTVGEEKCNNPFIRS
jgi:hydroxyacylglutathione hydrolase